MNDEHHIALYIVWAILFMVTIGFVIDSVRLRRSLKKKVRQFEIDLRRLHKDKNDKILGQAKYYELGMMSAGVAHEINNPLAIIQARIPQLIRIARDPAKINDLIQGLEQILYTSERINRTIQGVREFIHHDESAIDQEVSIQDLVSDVLAFCGQRMENHGVSLRFYGIKDFIVKGNKIQIEQILLNLLNNAFDAIEYLPEKWIEISVQDLNDRIQIFVKDSGKGIPKEISQRMMEPFFTTKQIGKGTGIGLALACGLAEKHQGKLSYLEDSAHTTFVLDLPNPDAFEAFERRGGNRDLGQRELH